MEVHEIKVIARIRSDFKSKFGIPRQSGLVEELTATVVFEPEFSSPDAVRGLEEFSHIWLIWEFSTGKAAGTFQATVRPPRLGGNRRVGVFASRSPFRPNPLGLSSVRLESIDYEAKGPDGKPIGPVINVLGADLMDGTPIYDIKPYVECADSHPGVHSGFVDGTSWEPLEVVIPEGLESQVSDIDTLREVLSLDPRPHYQDDPSKEYGMSFAGKEVRFKVEGQVLSVISVK